MVFSHTKTMMKRDVFKTPRSDVDHPRFLALPYVKKHCPSPGGSWLNGWVDGWLVGVLAGLAGLAGWLGWQGWLDGWLAGWLLARYGRLVSI